MTDIGDLMKALERAPLPESIDSSRPFYIRIDGRSFSTFTKLFTKYLGVDRQFNDIIRDAMVAATINVCEDLRPTFAYTQSDEASFGWIGNANPESEHPFGGKIQKLISVSASTFASGFVSHLYPECETPELVSLLSKVSFDSRIVDVGNLDNLQTMFYWRNLDCRRNAVSTFMQQKFSQKELNGVKTYELRERIENSQELSAEWIDIDDVYKVGTFITKVKSWAYGRAKYATCSHGEFVEYFKQYEDQYAL